MSREQFVNVVKTDFNTVNPNNSITVRLLPFATGQSIEDPVSLLIVYRGEIPDENNTAIIYENIEGLRLVEFVPFLGSLQRMDELKPFVMPGGKLAAIGAVRAR